MQLSSPKVSSMEACHYPATYLTNSGQVTKCNTGHVHFNSSRKSPDVHWAIHHHALLSGYQLM